MFPFNRSAKRPEWGMPHACVLHRVYWFQIMIITLIMSVVNWSLWLCSIDSLLVIRGVTRVIMTSKAVRCFRQSARDSLLFMRVLAIITICFEGRAESLCRQQYIPGSGRQLDVTLIVPPQMCWIPLYPDTGVNNMMKRGSKRFSGLLQHWRLWVLNWSWSKRESITGEEWVGVVGIGLDKDWLCGSDKEKLICRHKSWTQPSTAAPRLSTTRRPFKEQEGSFKKPFSSPVRCSMQSGVLASQML